MSPERELDEGIKSIKSAWRREHTARTNLKRMLEQAEAENAKLKELVRCLYDDLKRGPEPPDWIGERRLDMQESGIEVDND